MGTHMLGGGGWYFLLSLGAIRSKWKFVCFFGGSVIYRSAINLYLGIHRDLLMGSTAAEEVWHDSQDGQILAYSGG